MSTNQNKSVIVTGAKSGIGQAIARGFANIGYKVCATDIGEIPNPEPNIIYSALDVRDQKSVREVIGPLEDLQVVVNCAGIIRRSEEHDENIFQQVVDINLNGTMRVCTAARPLLAINKGVIINMASMLSYFGGGLVPAYSASKGGIAQLTKSLAIAYAVDGIRVNALAPGWIATPLTENLQNDSIRSKELLNRTPLGRWGQPEDLVGPSLFLASPEASFITGTILNVDGGYAVM